MREALRALFERLQWFKDDRRAWPAILLVCVGGIAYGFYYYAEQFALTPWFYWIFVPDSPLAVLWAALALVLYRLRRRNDFVDALAFVANVQVGLWTAYVLLYYDSHFRISSLNLNFWLFWLHLGMVALAFLFARDLARSFWDRPGRKMDVLVPVALWVLLNDVLDYMGPRLYPAYGDCALRPITVPCTSAEPLLAIVTFSLTAVAFLLLAALTRALRPRGG